MSIHSWSVANTKHTQYGPGRGLLLHTVMSSYFNGILKKITSQTSPSTPISGLVPDIEEPERGEYKGRVVSIWCPAATLLVKRLKTLKHPNIIQYVTDSLDSGGSSNSLWLVTEPVRPLQLEEINEHKDWAVLIAWQAASAVLFLNRQAAIAHCNLQNITESMFIDDMGMFKLGGFETSLSRRGDSQEVDRLCRMTGCSSADQLNDASLASIDHPRIISFIQNNLKLKINSLEQFLSENESHRLVQLVSRLDSLHIDVDLDKMATIKAASIFCQSPSCPKPLIFKVLMTIFGTVQNTDIPCDTVRLLLDCLTRLLNSQQKNVYQKRCLDIYAALLSNCKDRNVRLILIEGVERIMGLVGDSFCQSNIYPFLTSSLLDSSNASIRDASLRTLISMATQGRLQSGTVSGDLLKQIARLQDDSQAGIRANLLIGMSKLSPILSEDVRVRVIGPAYCRGLTDPFTPSKIAALSGLLEAGKSCSRLEIATRLLPNICPLLVDEDNEIASRAVAAVDLFMSIIKEHTKPWKSPALKSQSLPVQHQSATEPEPKSVEEEFKDMSINNQSEESISTPANTVKSQFAPGRGRLGATRKLQ